MIEEDLLRILHDIVARHGAEGAGQEMFDAVYNVTVKLFESLEHNGFIHGNGHHMAQELGEYARQQVLKRWISVCSSEDGAKE